MIMNKDVDYHDDSADYDDDDDDDESEGYQNDDDDDDNEDDDDDNDDDDDDDDHDDDDDDDDDNNDGDNDNKNMLTTRTLLQENSTFRAVTCSWRMTGCTAVRQAGPRRPKASSLSRDTSPSSVS